MHIAVQMIHLMVISVEEGGLHWSYDKCCALICDWSPQGPLHIHSQLMVLHQAEVWPLTTHGKQHCPFLILVTNIISSQQTLEGCQQKQPRPSVIFQKWLPD